MKSRFILGQQALTPDGAVYQIIMDEPYDENTTPDAVVQMLSDDAPENTVAGLTCIYNTEDAGGYPVEWLFAFDGTNWALDRVIRGGSAGGGGVAIPLIELTPIGETGGTYTSTIPFGEMSNAAERFGYLCPLFVSLANVAELVIAECSSFKFSFKIETYRTIYDLYGDGHWNSIGN